MSFRLETEHAIVLLVGALDGILIADFSRVLAGPLATMTLGDFGAEVIKIEPPGGDETRSWLPPVDDRGRSTYFLSVNRNKKSIVLDLKAEDDLEVAKAIVGKADVVVENFRPGTMARFGLDHETVSTVNPGVVYCSISGFGSGEGASLPGYDPLVEAVSGLMSVTGPAAGPASKVGVAVVDVIAGMNAATGILAALRQRDETGVGQRVEVNLLNSALAGLANQSGSFLATGVSPTRHGNAHPSIEPFGTFEAADGPLMICAGNDHQFRRLVEVIGERSLADEGRFATNPERVENRVELRGLIETRLGRRTVGEWEAVFAEAGVPAGPVKDIGGGFELADRLGLDPVDEFEGVRTPSSPIGLSGSPAETGLSPPDLDEHGEEMRVRFGSH
jgi:crotonobetainyl-CoA:carnitine CoA-transferase CaiB-like acyl-CoA transferase